MQVDVLVVGGGIAGAAAGYFLATGRTVLLVERETAYGYHATGRSAAEWTAAHCEGQKRALALLGEPFLELPPAGFAPVPLLRRRGNIMFSRPGDEATVEAYFEKTRIAMPQLRPMAVDEAFSIVPFLRRERFARCYYDPDNAEIDVDALHQGFLRGIRARGGSTRAGVEFDGAERRAGSWQVRLGADTVVTPCIVNAAGAWADEVAARAGVAPLGLEPRRRTAFTFDPGFDARTVPPVDEIGSGFYFKASGAALMVSLGDATPSVPCDAQPEDLDVAMAVDLFEQYTTLEVRRLASQWAGLRTFTRDEQPVAGFATDAEGFFWLVGQGGAGIMTSPGLGQVAASLVVGEPLSAQARDLGLSAAALAPARLAVGT
jgi:D-arginine dehydrogenase